MTRQNIQYMKSVYQSNKTVSIGSVCQCPSCGTAFAKEHYQQVFCKTQGGTVCKDKYWNSVTPSKRNNTTRISPANGAYQEQMRECREDSFMYNMRGMDDDDPSWDAHKDTM